MKRRDRSGAALALGAAVSLWLVWSAWLVSAVNYGWHGGEGALDGGGWLLVLLTFAVAPAAIARLVYSATGSRSLTLAGGAIAGTIAVLGFAVTALP